MRDVASGQAANPGNCGALPRSCDRTVHRTVTIDLPVDCAVTGRLAATFSPCGSAGSPDRPANRSSHVAALPRQGHSPRNFDMVAQ